MWGRSRRSIGSFAFDHALVIMAEQERSMSEMYSAGRFGLSRIVKWNETGFSASRGCNVARECLWLVRRWRCVIARCGERMEGK